MRSGTTAVFAALFLAFASAAAACEGHKTSLTLDAGVAPRANGGLVLHLDDVRVKAGEAAVLRVFVNHPAANAETPTSDARFVDELFIVPAQTSTSGEAKSHNFTLAVPASAVKAGESVKVTLVPGEKDGQVNVTVKRARLVAR